jgi:hypothetical protein
LAANPFRYQGPVAPERLIDRARELDALQRSAADRVAIRLAAPRRFGKTSLVNAHLAAMREAGHRGVRVDFSQVASVADACGRVARAYAQLPPDPAQTLNRLLQRFGVAVGPSGFTVRLSAAQRPIAAGLEEARQLLAELLDLPLAIPDARGDLTVVCFDEFQDLLVADTRLDGLVRSVIQHHEEAVAYVYAGSQPSLMRALFEDRERPFYGQARPLALPPLPADEAVRDIGVTLAGEDLPVTAAVVEIVAAAAGHPQRTMLLAHHLFNVLSEGAAVQDAARAALERSLTEVEDALQAVWDGLDRPERLVVLALAQGNAPTGSGVAAEHSIARSTLRAALERLSEREQHVVRRDGHPQLLDPLLGEWLWRR